MIHLQKFVKESKVKIKTYLLLLFRKKKLKYQRDKISNIYHHRQNRRSQRSKQTHTKKCTRKMKNYIKNLSPQKLIDVKKSVFRKGPLFIPNPTDWFNVKREIHNFLNNLCYMATKPSNENQKHEDPQSDLRNISGLRDPLPIQL